MSFTTTPDSLEEEIAANIALSRTDAGHEPSKAKLWTIYSNRENLTLTDEMSSWLYKIYLLRDLPFFYWCKSLNPDHIQDLIRESVDRSDTLEAKSNIIKTSLMFGERFYKGTVGKFTKTQREHIGYTKDNFDRKDIEDEFNQYSIQGMRGKKRDLSKNSFENYLEDILNDTTKELSKNNDRELRDKAIAIDFYLYSSFALSSD